MKDLRTTRPEQVHPRGLYDVDEVRHIIAPAGKPFTRDTVYRCHALKRQRLGARGGRTAWLGRDLLAYLGIQKTA